MNSELENAFNKELSLIKNDLYFQQIELQKGSSLRLIRFDIMYKPLEILAGDSYSIRKTKDGKVVFFLIDAMGKGISASITATTATSLLNYIFDELNKKKKFDFKEWIKRYLDYTKDELLDNEMVSILFGCYDRKEGSLDYASFGMPAILLVDKANKLHKFKSNNMPITKYHYSLNISTQNVWSMKKALFYTDGLCESLLEGDKFYKEQMCQDFQDSANVVDFTKRVQQKISFEGDDISFFYVQILKGMKDAFYKEIPARRDALDEALFEMNDYVRQESEATTKCISELTLALSEILSNSLEHGVFGIANKTKHYLINASKMDEEIERLEKVNADKNIKLYYTIVQEQGKKIFVARIEDAGVGFDTKMLRGLVVNAKSFNGRGLMIVKKLLDRIYYSEKGNSITIRKYLG